MTFEIYLNNTRITQVNLQICPRIKETLRVFYNGSIVIGNVVNVIHEENTNVKIYIK